MTRILTDALKESWNEQIDPPCAWEDLTLEQMLDFAQTEILATTEMALGIWSCLRVKEMINASIKRRHENNWGRELKWEN